MDKHIKINCKNSLEHLFFYKHTDDTLWRICPIESWTILNNPLYICLSDLRIITKPTNINSKQTTKKAKAMNKTVQLPTYQQKNGRTVRYSCTRILVSNENEQLTVHQPSKEITEVEVWKDTYPVTVRQVHIASPGPILASVHHIPGGNSDLCNNDHENCALWGSSEKNCCCCFYFGKYNLFP